MARQTTTYLQLIKPKYDEDADIKDINDNMDAIDAAYHNLIGDLAPEFAQATANDAESYVTYSGKIYYLPNGHSAGTTWANTTKTLTNIGERLKSIKENAGAQIDDTAGSGVSNKVWSANKLANEFALLLSVIAPAFAQGTANAAESYVTYDGEFYYLPSGHTAGTTWANTTKTKKNIGEVLAYLKVNAGGQTAPYINDDNGMWYQWDTTNHVYVNTGIPAQGPQGDDGADGHNPYINENTGYWMVWDTNENDWVETNVPATGPAGQNGARGQKGDQGDPAPAEDVADAVADWMSANITPDPQTVIDSSLSVSGAAADAKIAGDLINSKADAVWASSAAKNSFNATELAELGEYHLECDATGYNTIYVSQYEDLCPLTDANTNGIIEKSAGVNKTHSEGTPESAARQYMKVNNSAHFPLKEAVLQGDTLYFAVYVDGDISAVESGTEPGRFEFIMNYSDSTSKEIRLEYGLTSGVYTTSFTAEKDMTTMDITLRCRVGYTFDTDFSWAISRSAFSSVTVPSNGKVIFDPSDIGTDGFAIIPTPAVSKSKVTLEEYIAGQVPPGMLVKEDLMYLSPEMFGAVGDGNTNDTAAINACIDAAKLNIASDRQKIPIRGYGRYKITSGINIVGTYMDIYLNEILMSGTFSSGSYAVRLSGRNNRLQINWINAYGATNTCGFRLETQDGNDNCQYNELIFGRVDGYTNAIEFVNEVSGKSIYYNRLHINTTIARNGNCFYFKAISNGSMNENSFWAKKLTCNNGYGIYNDGWTGSPSHRFYECTFEATCKNAVYGWAVLFNVRTVECMDLMREETPDSGRIFVFNNIPARGGLVYGDTQIDYVAVDVTEAMTLAEAEAEVQYWYDTGNESKSHAFDYAGGGILLQRGGHVLCKCERLWDYYAVPSESGLRTDANYVHGHIIVYFNHKGFVPDDEWETDVNVSSYTPLVTEPKFPTTFVIKANTTINLDDSYCPIGINKVKIVQQGGYKAVVKSKDNVTIFDGTNQTDGTYLLTCSMTNYTFSFVSERTGNTVTYTEHCKQHFYGPNEKWTVEKLNIIS